jgi:hypothetical protein
MCERYASFANVNQNLNNSIETADLDAALKQFAGKSASFILTDHATEVQDQGQEGACTAYGMAHTVEAVINKAAGSADFTSPADPLWQTYKEPQMEAALSAALKWNFKGSNGKTARVSSIKSAKSITELLTMLSEGPLWAASEVNQSWQAAGQAGNATLSCGGQVMGGHSFSLHGFKVNKEGTAGVVYVKNSWGTKFGDNGYGELPLQCLSQMSQLPFQAHQVIATAQ